MTDTKTKRTLTLEIRAAFICRDCDRLYRPEDEDIPKLRECSSDTCGETFASTERNCPQCNRPFTRVVADQGCEDCAQELEEIDYVECPECGDPLKCGACEAHVGGGQ